MGHLYESDWREDCSIPGCPEDAKVGIEVRYGPDIHLCEKHATEIMQYIETWVWFAGEAEEGDYFRQLPDSVRHMCRRFDPAVVPGYEYCPECGAGRKAGDYARAA